jgi:hypothetical protein
MSPVYGSVQRDMSHGTRRDLIEADGPHHDGGLVGEAAQYGGRYVQIRRVDNFGEQPKLGEGTEDKKPTRWKGRRRRRFQPIA